MFLVCPGCGGLRIRWIRGLNEPYATVPQVEGLGSRGSVGVPRVCKPQPYATLPQVPRSRIRAQGMGLQACVWLRDAEQNPHLLHGSAETL